ncbi:putative oxidoreductase [Gordonia polyisoprenivorans NBRC 16320 = JCM 10675]|uniref:Flavin reductase family protein n=1 Tax=Gordonia polyisoprenivorans TaxID=84595 RepID=A0A846WGR9_9ACTN|nr:flavin reductase family protein [Gordonia polyisoprenivorans]NKY00137.1 flavin reductase family protein [Gordonia polyisoprenivorans]WCB38340.1 flavin reductase family protein [Gordonia polyisoprenivorans]GAB25759.1 putative oxidoreductase [Gordonia polyisoprenivorans NBRC 16320 = JCM 10675]
MSLEDFRHVLGHFPTGVTVVTAMTQEGPTGFCCQSFSSLSLDPPMVLILPARTSTTWPRIEAAGRFCVNVLGHDQADLALGFARSGGDKFAGVIWAPGHNGAPRVEGACAWIEAEVASIGDGGDHVVVHGRVSELTADSSVAPLIFHRGEFAQLNCA